MASEFDLMSGKDYSAKQEKAAKGKRDKKNPHEKNKLLWHKIVPNGFMMSSFEGHSSCSFGENMYICGGLEGGSRVNSVFSFHVPSASFSLVNCHGDVPCPRSHHACVVYNGYMIIHGGEGTAEKPLPRSVCPGDSLTKENKNVIVHKHTSAMSGDIVHCYDDMKILNLRTYEWINVPSVLAPLPRKSHTITYARLLGDADVFFLFGGKSNDSGVVSNSLHVCSADRAVDPSPDATDPLVWRLVDTNGAPPGPRSKHTCSFVSGTSNRSSLVETDDSLYIFGGVGAENELFEDMHILNMVSLYWTTVKSADSFDTYDGLLNDGKLPALSGHVALVIPCISKRLNKGFQTILIFGGRCLEQEPLTNMSLTNNEEEGTAPSISECSNQYIYQFDTMSRVWSRVQYGYDFPPCRVGHTAAVIPNFTWARENVFQTPSPTPAVADDATVVVDPRVELQPHAYTPLSMGSPTPVDAAPYFEETPNSPGFALIFGGLSQSGCNSSDVWALDLTWRHADIRQFNTHTESSDASINDSFAPRRALSGSLMTHQSTGSLHPLVSQTQRQGINQMHTSASAASLFAPLAPQYHKATSRPSPNSIRYQAQQSPGSVLEHTEAEETARMMRGGVKEALEEGPDILIREINGDNTEGILLTDKYVMSQSRSFESLVEATDGQPADVIMTQASNDSGLLFQGGRSASNVNDADNSPREISQRTALSHPADNSALNNSLSLPNITNISLNATSFQGGDGGLNAIVMRLRKEKAYADTQVVAEREKVINAESTISGLALQVEQYQQQIEELSARHAQETKCLREALEESVGRERCLETLNEEAYTLLLLQEGMKK